MFYLHLEPGQCFGGAGIWHPDNATLTKVRTAITGNPEAWAKVRGQISEGCQRLKKPPRGFDPDHRFIEDLKLKDLVASIPFNDEQVCSSHFLADYAAHCRKLAPLLEFTTKAIGLKF